MHEAGHPKPVLWNNLEGWGLQGGQREVQDEGTHIFLWPIHVDIWQKASQYYKVIILQLKLINFLNKKRERRLMQIKKKTMLELLGREEAGKGVKSYFLLITIF